MKPQKENKNLPPLNLPQVDLKLKLEGGLMKLFDPVRNKFVALTPEEYVRRHFTNWLVSELHYPISNIANEVGVKVNGTSKRCDTLVIDRYGEPLVIVEYKAPGVNITQAVFDQIVRYNISLKARYLIVSNGLKHYCCIMDYKSDSYHFIPTIPDYNEIVNQFSDN